jgi:phosphatidylinositol alpha-mannosyltransferase
MVARLDATALGGAAFMNVGAASLVSVNGSRAPVSPWPATMARTVSALRSFAPEVVHVHEPVVPGPSLAALIMGPRPVVGTFHRSGADFAYRAYGHLVAPWVRRLDAVFAVSEEAKATALACVGRLAGVIEVIPNGVEVRGYESVEPWPAKAPTVAFVGRHEPRKGLGILLDAFGSLPDSTRLWVMGSGPETPALQSRYAAQRRIEWLGVVDDEERAARLKGADVLVAPSIGGESFGVVLLEAMAAGTAVVASDLPGYRLAGGGAARLVPAGDPAALAKAVGGVLLDDAERARLADRGRQRASECDMAGVADSYRDAYARLGRQARSG